MLTCLHQLLGYCFDVTRPEELLGAYEPQAQAQFLSFMLAVQLYVVLMKEVYRNQVRCTDGCVWVGRAAAGWVEGLLAGGTEDGCGWLLLPHLL